MDVFYQAFKLDWDNNFRKIFDFRNNQITNESIYLKKLENNLNVSYYLFSSNKLIDLEKAINNVKQESTKINKNNLKRKGLWIYSDKMKLINEAFFMRYQIKLGEKTNFSETNIEKISEGSIIFKLIDTEAKFQGKEIRGYLASVEGREGFYIFKEPKINDFNFDMKIRIQLIAQDLAKEFSNFVIFLNF
jgi:hypothetical protein